MCFALQCVEKPLRWAIHTIKPLGSFVSGNVAILGDAVSALFDMSHQCLTTLNLRRMR